MAPASDAVQLSVVVPVYNEEKKIRQTVQKIAAFMGLKGSSWELIVVSDGSGDGTDAILENLRSSQKELPLVFLKSDRNYGKGAALKKGMLVSRGKYVLMTDADLSAPIKESDKLVRALEGGADVAVGSRAVRKAGCDVRQSPKRYVAGRIFNFFVRLFVLQGIRDSQCGFKCFTQEAAQRLFGEQKLEGFSFDVEVLYLARRHGYRIAEVPVMWREGEDSRISLFNDSIRMLRDVLKIKKLHA